MNFNGQLLPGFSFFTHGSHPLLSPSGHPPPPLGACPGSQPAPGILRAPQKPSPGSPLLPLQWGSHPEGTTTSAGCSLWCCSGHLGGFFKIHGCGGSGDSTSEVSVSISSCLTPPRGTIMKGSNLITIMQQSAGEHISAGPGHG